jgi:hypothetical protein
MTEMRMRQQLIVVFAVVFATVAVGMNVYASTRADQRSQELALEMPVASVLDRGVFDTPRPADPSDDSTPPNHSNANHSNAPDDSRALSDVCPGLTDDAADPAFSNHGRDVSAFAAHIGYRDCVDGPPGALVREKARPEIERERPPRSDRAEERSSNDDKAPPGLTKDDPSDEDSDDDEDKDKDEDH